MGYPYRDCIRTKVYADVLLQIKTGSGRERAVQLDPLRAPRPGVEQLVLDFDLSRENSEFSRGGRPLQIDAAIDRDAWLQLRDFDEGIAEIAANPLQFRGALFSRPSGPALQPKKDEREHRGNDQGDQR